MRLKQNNQIFHMQDLLRLFLAVTVILVEKFEIDKTILTGLNLQSELFVDLLL